MSLLQEFAKDQRVAIKRATYQATSEDLSSSDLASGGSYQASGREPSEHDPAEIDVSTQLMAQLLQHLGKDAFDLWFRRGAKAFLQGKRLHIVVDNDFLVDCIRSFCMTELRAVVSAILGDDTDINVRCDAASAAKLPPATLVAAASNAVPRPSTDARNSFEEFRSQLAGARSHENEIAKGDVTQADSQLSSRQSNAAAMASVPAAAIGKKVVSPFLPGDSNRLAMTAAEMVIERPGELGPLFIHGTHGVGKSHLCKVVAEQLKSRHRMRRVMYMTAEQFTIDFTESTRGAGFAAFRKKYRDVEALIIDDAQFFLGKTQTIAELRNTVDDLLSRRRQVVLCADRSLADLIGLGVDLHARLSGGVTCTIALLDRSLRRDLLRELCKRHQVLLADDTIEELADCTSGDGRAIYGVVFRLMAQQRANGGKLSREEALNCTLDLIRASQPVVRINDIERVVCETFGIEPSSLKGKNRSKSVTGPRMLAMFLARKHTQAAFAEIGQYFGNRQHSTVIAAHKKVEDWVAANELLNHRSGTVGVRDLIRSAESLLQVG